MSSELLAVLRQTILSAKPRRPRPLAAPLQLEHGWLLPYLLTIEGRLWGRWDHWHHTMLAGRVIQPLPVLDWESHPAARRMLEASLNSITTHGSWQGWGSWQVFDYFLDWLLFGLGHRGQPSLPDERAEFAGASARLYQVFNLETLLAWPHDYLGDILAENRHGQQLGFYPTPMPVAQMMAAMTLGSEDARCKSVCDPCVGTGRLLLAASNHSYRLYGCDLNPTVLKATLVNGWLYAPWLVRPFPFLDPLLVNPAASAGVSESLIAQARPEQLQLTEHDPDTQALFEPLKKRRVRRNRLVANATTGPSEAGLSLDPPH